MKEAVKHSATNNHQHKPFFDKTGTAGIFDNSNEAVTEPFFQGAHIKPAVLGAGGNGGSGGAGGGDVIQKKNGPPPPQGSKGQKPGGGKAGLTSAQRPLTHFNIQAKKFKDGSSIAILTSAVVGRVYEVVHDRKGAAGNEKLPYEYLFRYQRRVSIKTADQESVTLDMEAESYLPFAEVDGKTSLSLKDALAMKADFSKVKWTVSGGFNKDKYGKALKGKYGIEGTKTTIKGKEETLFFFDEFYKQDIVKADNARTAIAMPDLATKPGLAFLQFNLSEAQQYQSIVDYMNSLMGHHIDEEYKLRTKKQKKQTPQKDPPPAPKGEPEEVIEDTGDVDPDAVEDLHKHDDLPGWMKAIGSFFGSIANFFVNLWNKLPAWARGILKTVGELVVVVLAVVAVAAVIVFFLPELAIGTVVFTIFALIFAFGFGFSLGTRWRQSTSIKEFLWSIPVAIFDTLGITDIYESFTDKSIFTGDDIDQDEEERWHKRSRGILSLLGSLFGLRSWSKRPRLPGGGRDPVPPGMGGQGGRRGGGIFSRLKQWFFTPRISKSKKSLLEFLERVWGDRQAISKGDKTVYELYTTATEPNPLQTKTAAQYIAEVEQLKQGKTNFKDLKDGTTRLDDATDVVYHEQGDAYNGFTHFYRKSGNGATERIYLNVKSDYAPEFMRILIREVIAKPKEYPGVHGGKVNGATSATGRPDVIVLFLEDAASARRVLGFVNAVKKLNPWLFNETTPPMTSQATPGISRAHEPVQTPGQKRLSFGQSRSKAITEALDNTMKKNGTKEDFIAEVEKVFGENNINPDSPHLNQ